MPLRFLILCTAALVASPGCVSSESAQSVSRETSRIRFLVNLYQLASPTGPPKSEAEFKRAIQNIHPDALAHVLTSAKVSSIDELFISERDGQPYVIFYRPRPKGVADDLIAYEQIGVGGKRYVGYGIGAVEEVDDERFAELVPAASR